MSSSTTIKFFRSSTISNSLQEAIDKLNAISHLPGQPVIAYYYLNDKVNCVLALGITEGIGKNAYSIISTEDKIIVDKIIFGELPDVTELSEKSITLCKVPESNTIYWVTRSGANRVVTEITDENTSIQVKEISSGKYWWVNSQEIKEASDFPTKSEFNSLSNRTQGLEQTNKGIIFPTQKRHNEEINRLMNKTFPMKINFFRKIMDEDREVIKSINDCEVFESGTVTSIDIILSLENKALDITNECTWKMKRTTSMNGDFVKIDDPKNISLEICSDSELFVFKAIHPEFGEIEKEYKAIFTLKTIIGKIKYPETITYPEFYTAGKGLPYDDETFSIEEQINSIPEENKIRVLRSDQEEIIVSDKFEINEYLFIAIPTSHKEFSDIIDPITGNSLLDSFNCLKEETTLTRDSKGNTGGYYLYVKKLGIHSSGKTLSLIFKP